MEEAIFLIQRKLEHIKLKYEALVYKLHHLKKHSRRWQETLGAVQSTGNQKAVLTQLLNEMGQVMREELKLHRIARRGKIIFFKQSSQDKYDSCEKKIKHRTKKAAEAQAASVMQEHHEQLVTYKCRYANHWHNGHDILQDGE